MNYARVSCTLATLKHSWPRRSASTGKNMVEGEGFEPSKAEPSDLQSDPFDHSGTPPIIPRRSLSTRQATPAVDAVYTGVALQRRHKTLLLSLVTAPCFCPFRARPSRHAIAIPLRSADCARSLPRAILDRYREPSLTPVASPGLQAKNTAAPPRGGTARRSFPVRAARPQNRVFQATLVPPQGVEPWTFSLQVSCSTS